FNRTSVMWALMLAVVLVGINQNEKVKEWQKTAAIFVFCVLAFPADWSSIAVMAPLFIYFHSGDRKKQMADIVIWTAVYALVYFLFLDRVYGLLQMFTFLSIPLLMLYNGERGKAKGMKWLFYIYYPAHLIVVGIVRLALHGNIPIIFQ
ncbi:MAG: conjugal transfer protein TraX, partial [Clostridia bacterium]|nr:conjugal transfer protein TraX [Clostridia bacterium]